MAEPVSPLLDDGQEPSDRRTAAAVGRDVNAVIREMTERLDAIAATEQPVGFLCECGCLAIVEATVTEYDSARGVWLKGHEPS